MLLKTKQKTLVMRWFVYKSEWKRQGQGQGLGQVGKWASGSGHFKVCCCEAQEDSDEVVN
jgi:hypothetical protein